MKLYTKLILLISALIFLAGCTNTITLYIPAEDFVKVGLRETQFEVIFINGEKVSLQLEVIDSSTDEVKSTDIIEAGRTRKFFVDKDEYLKIINPKPIDFSIRIETSKEDVGIQYSDGLNEE